MVAKTWTKNKVSKLLEKLYTSTHASSCYTSVEPLYREAKQIYAKIKRSDVKNFLYTKDAYTRHRRAVRRFKRLPIIAPGLHTHWHADLADFRNIKRYNANHSYLLVCIDCLSRQLFVEPVKQKTAKIVADSFSKIFKRSKYIPWYLYTDQGREFSGAAAQQLFKKHSIFHRYMYTWPELHACMAERAIRTIKERLHRYFTDKKTKKWLPPVIQQLCTSINNSPHRSLNGLCPSQVNFGNASDLRKMLWEKLGVYREETPPSPKFKLGDHVRIEIRKGPFEKGYKPRFSSEIFTVTKIRRGTPGFPVAYKLLDDNGETIIGWFYNQSLCNVL